MGICEKDRKKKAVRSLGVTILLPKPNLRNVSRADLAVVCERKRERASFNAFEQYSSTLQKKVQVSLKKHFGVTLTSLPRNWP